MAATRIGIREAYERPTVVAANADQVNHATGPVARYG